MRMLANPWATLSSLFSLQPPSLVFSSPMPGRIPFLPKRLLGLLLCSLRQAASGTESVEPMLSTGAGVRAGVCVYIGLAGWRRLDDKFFLSNMGAYHMPMAMAMSRQVVEMIPAGQIRKIQGVKILCLVALNVYVVLACWFWVIADVCLCVSGCICVC